MDNIKALEIFEEINYLDNTQLDKKIEMMKEVIESGYFCENDYYSQFESKEELIEYREEGKNPNNLVRFFTYRGEEKRGPRYRKNKKDNKIDLDVSLAAVVTYSMMYGIAPDKIEQQNSRINENDGMKYEIRNENEFVFRGDTMTSAWTVFKQYITLLWFLNDEENENNFKNLFEKHDKNTLKRPDKQRKYKNLRDYMWDNIVNGGINNNFRFSSILTNKISKDALQFLNAYMMSGNYLMIPMKFNVERSNYGKWDTADRLLWKFYQYFYYKTKENDDNKADQYLKELFTVEGEKLNESLSMCKRWLSELGIKKWNDFIEIHCLQDYVENKEGKKYTLGEYGRPISLKTNEPIDLNLDKDYESIPKSKDEFEIFFSTANSMIEKRTKRIFNQTIKKKSNFL